MTNMKDLFNDVLDINGVKGVVLLAGEGKVVYDSDGNNQTNARKPYSNWNKLLVSLGDAREAEFVFEKGRLYFRKTHDGFMIIRMQLNASIAMVKLNCDILLPQLKSTGNSKGLKGFFKR
jgi:hypothetical protein